jgi:hypothetical protein
MYIYIYIYEYTYIYIYIYSEGHRLVMTVEGIAADYTNPTPVHTNPSPVHTNPTPVRTTPVNTNPTPVLPSPLRGRRPQTDPIYSYVIVKILAVQIAMSFGGLTSGEGKDAVTMDEDSGVSTDTNLEILCISSINVTVRTMMVLPLPSMGGRYGSPECGNAGVWNRWFRGVERDDKDKGGQVVEEGIRGKHFGTSISCIIPSVQCVLNPLAVKSLGLIVGFIQGSIQPDHRQSPKSAVRSIDGHLIDDAQRSFISIHIMRCEGRLMVTDPHCERCIHIHRYVYTYTYLYMYIYIYIYVHIYIYMYIYMFHVEFQTLMNIHIHTFIFICMYVSFYLYLTDHHTDRLNKHETEEEACFILSVINNDEHMAETKTTGIYVYIYI